MKKLKIIVLLIELLFILNLNIVNNIYNVSLLSKFYTDYNNINNLIKKFTSQSVEIDRKNNSVNDIYYYTVYNMQSWQIKKCKNNITPQNALNYLKGIGRLNNWFKNFYPQPQKIMELNEKYKILLDNYHEFRNVCWINRNNLCILMIQSYKKYYYSIINECLTDGIISALLVKTNEINETIDYASGNVPISNGFTANIVNWPEATIVFGSLNKTYLGGKNFEENIQTNFKKIKIYTSENEEFTINITDPNCILVMLEPGKKINIIQMIDINNNIVEESPIFYIY